MLGDGGPDEDVPARLKVESAAGADGVDEGYGNSIGAPVGDVLAGAEGSAVGEGGLESGEFVLEPVGVKDGDAVSDVDDVGQGLDLFAVDVGVSPVSV